MNGGTVAALLPERANSEGINTSVLQEYLHRLESRKCQVLAAFLKGLSHTAHAGPGLLQADAIASLAGQGPTVGNQLAALAAEHGQLSAHLAEAEAAEKKLDVLAQLQQRLADFDVLLSSGEFGEAALRAVELQRSSEEDRENAALRQQTEQRTLSMLQARRTSALSESVDTIVQVSQDGISVSGAAGAAKVWSGLATLHEQTPHLKALAERVMEGVILPLIQAGDRAAVQQSSDPHGSSTLQRQDGADASQGGLEDALLMAVRFISGVACGGHAATISELGHLLWPKLAAVYIERRLAPAVPHNEASLDAFQSLTKAAERLEKEAAAMGLAPVNDEGKGRIQLYVGNALDKALRGRRLKIVGAARDIVMKPDQDTDIVGMPLPVNPEAVAALRERLAQGRPGEGAATLLNWGSEGQEGPVLATGRFRITRSADALVKLIHQAASEAAASRSPALAQTLVAAVTDVADLAAALPPKARAREMQLPQPASLYHNDCQHLGNQILGLPFTHAPNLTQLAPSAPTQLIDAAQRLRAAGAAVLATQAARQAEEMAGVLAQAEGWRGLHQAQRGISARRVVQQASHALRRMGDVLGGTLAPPDFVRMAAAAVDALAERAGDDILAMRDISVEESEELPRILAPIADDAPAAALGGANALDQAPVDRELLITAIEAASPSLARLKASHINMPEEQTEVLFILGANLAQIEERWDSGRLPSARLSSQHVTSLIQALFEDTQRRQEALHHIRTSKA